MIIWDRSLETGIPAIDGQHKELITRVNNFLDACMKQRGKEELDSMLGFMSDYAVKHFADEQALHASSGYPKAIEHKFQHDKFMLDLKTLSQQYSKEGGTLNITLMINKTVVDWLVKHISGSDKEFANYYKNK